MDAPQSFVARYQAAARKKRSVLCVGIDLDGSHLPPGYQAPPEGILDYGLDLLDIAVTRVAVVKFQYAYYGALGTPGIGILGQLIAEAQAKGLLVILDAKRIDIGRTMERYGQQAFGVLGADACTTDAYCMGPTFLSNDIARAWMPPLNQGKLAITMVRTSNPEGDLSQLDRWESGELGYEKMARQVREWNDFVLSKTDGRGGIGGVVGATKGSQEAQRCRELSGDRVWFLKPGLGAQGGIATEAVIGLLDSAGRLMGGVNDSSGLTYLSWYDEKNHRAKDPQNSLKLVEQAADQDNLALNQALENLLGRDPYQPFDPAQGK